MDSRLPWNPPAADPNGGMRSTAAVPRGRLLITVLLLAAAAMDLTRCGLTVMTARQPMPAYGLAAAGLAVAALSVPTVRGCQTGRRWAGWAAFLIGVASAPQASASGFRSPYAIPDTATAALGVLLTVVVLATAGRTVQPGQDTESSCLASAPDSRSAPGRHA
jgi:hypothetical protein